jgi:hypothetical protein
MKAQSSPGTGDWGSSNVTHIYGDFTLRAKGLPITYASKSYEVWTTLRDMLQSSTTVVIEGVYITENCVSKESRRSYAFVYARNAKEGGTFIKDMAETYIDGQRLRVEWSSCSKHTMPAASHRLERSVGYKAIYWHPANSSKSWFQRPPEAWRWSTASPSTSSVSQTSSMVGSRMRHISQPQVLRQARHALPSAPCAHRTFGMSPLQPLVIKGRTAHHRNSNCSASQAGYPTRQASCSHGTNPSTTRRHSSGTVGCCSPPSAGLTRRHS